MMKSLYSHLAFLAGWASASATPVINEIHYNNDLNTVCNEFVELYNPDAVEVDLSGWQLTGAVEFTFPNGTILPALGYLVVGEEPAILASEFGVTALGPYSGRLNSEGESLELLNALQAEVDVVDYGVGFPWPSLAAGEGSSMELINGNLDNDLGSSWRSSGIGSEGPPAILVPQGSDWRFRRGESEASSPIDAWTANGFIEDATWLDGVAPFGRNEPQLVETAINDIFQNFSSVFLRREFTFNGNSPSALTLRVLYDDGAIVWLNGTEIFRSDSVDPGMIDYRGNDENNTNQIPHGTAISSDEQDGYEEFLIDGVAGLLQNGTNTLAVQVFNDSLGSSDFLIDAVLETLPPFFEQGPPTPGARNGAFSTVAPPNIRQVEHFPEAPISADPVTISARITDPDGVAEVTLAYQIVAPGNYIRRSDEEFESSWIELPMVDEANDGTYLATIPAAGHRELVRYRIISADGNGASVRAPFLDDLQPNFAYFVYDGVPAHTSANEPGVDAPVTFPAELLEDLPTYHLIADATDVTNSQYNTNFNNTRFLGTLVYDGEVHDHIEFEVGGTGSTYIAGKNKWRIHFNPTRDLEVRDNFGERYDETWNTLTMNACASPRVGGNRGLAGLDESFSFRVQQLVGSLSPNTSYLHFRVIDDAVEASPTDQYAGDLWGLYLAIEEINGGLLNQRDLPDGNLYRIEASGREHQAKNQVSDGSDFATFTSQSNNVNTETWWRENFDLEKYYNFRAANRVVGNVDLRFGGNHFFYHGTNDDGTQSRWVPIPWDLDFMFIAIGHQSGTIRQQNSLAHPAIEIEYQNRCREVLDLLVDDASVDGGQIGQLMEEFSEILNPSGQAQTWADIDQNQWNFNPLTNSENRPRFDHFGNFYLTPYTESRIGGTWTRTLETSDFEGMREYLLGYMTDTNPDPGSFLINSGDQRGYGYDFLTSEAADPNVPDRPTISYAGLAGFPANGLVFESTEFSDPQGVSTAAAIQYRIGEISALVGEPDVFEIEENWTSPVLSSFDLSITPPASAVVEGNIYRARVRHQDTSGRWSHWSEPLQFVAGGADVADLQQNLVISEIMYNPLTSQEHEYLELRNIGSSELDLTDVRFTDGIDFDFPIGTSIAPGAYLLVVRNLAAFEEQYGAGLPVVGAYGENESGSLSNGGESITLSLGSSPIHDFEYNDRAPWPVAADEAGSALALFNTSENGIESPLDILGHGVAANWRQGVSGGTPGVAEPSTLFSGDPDADNDADGLSALLEHALGSSDSSSGAAGFVVAFDGTQVSLTFPRNPLAGDIRYTVEVSSDLRSWTAGAVLDRQDATTATFVFEPAGGEAQRFFLRLRVEQVSAVQQ